MPRNTWLLPARAAFSMKRGIFHARASTCIMKSIRTPSSSRSRIRASNTASQHGLREKLSSVKK